MFSRFENLCPEIKIIGFDSDGSLAEYIAVDKNLIIPVPEGLSDEIAGLSEPLGMAVNGGEGGVIKTKILICRKPVL
ncbi:MAG: hypothetical protein MZU95_04430 [Desulfomicrobium escambiense]|nr:hypothetical protein [Desulfomicrobium escambiense]